MNLEMSVSRLEKIWRANQAPRTRPPQVHIWVNGDILPHGTPEEEKRNFYPAHVDIETGAQLDPDRDYVVHWCRPERLDELGFEDTSGTVD